jgi:aldehyde dehydrogenase (NAD+)
MKQTWVMKAVGDLPEMDEILRHATQVKNIWVPYGA